MSDKKIIFSLSALSLALFSIHGFASSTPLKMVNTDTGTSCIAVSVSNSGGTENATLTNNCADIGSGNSPMSVSLQVTKGNFTGSMYGNGGTAGLPYPSFSQSGNTATATYATGVWKEGDTLIYSWYQGDATIPASDLSVSTTPKPTYTHGTLNLKEDGVSSAQADILNNQTSTVTQTVNNLSSKDTSVDLPFGSYNIAPYLITNKGQLYTGTVDNNPVSVSNDNPYASADITYQPVTTPGHIKFTLSGTSQHAGFKFYNTSHTVADNVTLGSGTTTVDVPADSYNLPAKIMSETQNSGSSDYSRCTFTSSGSQTTVQVNAGQTVPAAYNASCSTVPAVNVTLAFSNDRTLSTKDSHNLTLTLQSTTYPSEVITKQITYTPGNSVPTIQVPGDDTYTVSVAVDSKDTDLQGYDVIASNLNVGTSDVSLPIEFKYKGTYSYANASDYEALLPKQANGQPNYNINIGETAKPASSSDSGAQIAYHCEYSLSPDGKELVRGKCDHEAININHIASIQPKGFGHPGIDLAMALAQGTMLERLELQHGFGSKDQFNSPDLANYFARNINPNSFLSRCTQETGTCAYVAGQGPYQLNNIALQLQSATNGGYPMPYALSSKDKLENHTAVDFIGGTLSAAMFDASDTGLYSPANVNKVAQPSTADPLAIQRVLDWIYNRGVDGLSTFTKNMSTCLADPNMINNTKCFDLKVGWGERYIRQVPNVEEVLSKKLTGAAYVTPNADGKTIVNYDHKVSLSDINNYLDILGPKDLGLYDQYDVDSAKQAAAAEFAKITKATGATTIDFRTQFGKVLEAIMTKLPVYQYQAPIPGTGPTPGPGPAPGPAPKAAHIQLSSSTPAADSLFFSTALQNGVLTPGQSSPSISADQPVTKLLAETPGYVPCSASAIASVNNDIKAGKDAVVTINGSECDVE